MNDNLRILVQATLNQGLSLKNINLAIQALSKHPSLQKLKLSLEIDKKVISQITGHTAAINRMTRAVDEQNKVVHTSTKEWAMANGMIQKTVVQTLKSGEKITSESLKQSKARAKEVKPIEDVNKALTDLGKTHDKVTAKFNREMKLTGFNTKLTEGYRTTVRNLGADGKTEVGKRVTYDSQKEIADTNKLIALREKQLAKLRELEQTGRNSEAALKDVNKAIESAKTIAELNKIQTKLRELEAASKRQIGVDAARLTANKRNTEQQIRNEKKLESQKLSAEKRIASLLNQHGERSGRIDANRLKEISAAIKGITDSSANGQKAISKFRHEIDMLAANAKKITPLQQALTKFPIWLGTASIIYGPLRALNSVVDTIITIDTQMTQLKRVMDEDTNFDNMLRSNIQLATQLGQTITTLNQGMIEFSRMGFDENQVLNLTKSAALAQNISEMSSTEAVNALTSAMIVFNIRSEDSLRIIDKINEIDNNFAVTSQNLAVSMTKAGSAAQTFGVSLDELLGNATAIMSATRESGSVVGNALKTIYSRITTMSESETFLDSVGISIRNLNDGSMRSVSEILGELASKWKNLNDEQRQNAGVTLAGRWQINKFLALMEGWDISLQATETSLHSQGSAIEENSKFMNSLQARINRMKSAWQELSIAMGDAVITDTLVALISLGTGLASLFTKATKTVGLLPIVLGSVGVAVTMLSVAFRGLVVSIGTTVAGLLGIPVAATAAVTATGALSAAIGVLKMSLRTLFVAAGPVGLAFAGIGLVVELLMRAFSKGEKSAADYEEALTTLSDKAYEVRRLDELKKRYNELASATEKTTEERIELSRIEGELTDKFGVGITKLDESTTAINDNNTAIERKISLAKEDLRIQSLKAEMEYRSDKERIDREIEKAKAAKDAAQAEMDRAEDAYTQFIKDRAAGRVIDNTDGKYSKDSRLTMFNVDPNGNQWGEQDALDNFEETLAGFASKAAQKFMDMNDSLKQAINPKELGIKGLFQGYLIELETGGKEITDTTRVLFDSLANVAATNNLDFSKEQLNQFFEVFNAAKIKTVDDAVKVFEKLPNGIKLSDAALDALRTVLLDMNFSATGDELDGMNDGMKTTAELVEDARKEIDKTSDELKTLNQAIHDVAKGEKLTAEEMDDLIRQFPELATKIDNTSGAYEFQKGVLETLRGEKLKYMNKSILAENGISNAVYDNLQKRLDLYKLELDSIVDVATAREMIAGVMAKTKEDLIKKNPILAFLPPVQLEALALAQEGVFNISSQLMVIGELQERIKNRRGLFSGSDFGVTTDDDKKDDDKKEKDKKLLDKMDATIAEIIDESRKKSEWNDRLLNNIKTLMDDGDFANALSKTKMLIASYNKEITLLKDANNDLLYLQNQMQNNNKAKFGDMSGWIVNGEKSVKFIDLYNKSSDENKKILDSLWERWKSVAEAISGNNELIKEQYKLLEDTIELVSDNRVGSLTKYAETLFENLEGVQYRLQIAQARQKTFAAGSKEFINLQSTIEQLMQKEVNANKAIVDWATRKLETVEKNSEAYKLLNGWIKTHTLAMHQSTAAIVDNTKAHEDAIKSIESDVYGYMSDLADDIIDIYEEVKDAQIDAIDARIKKIDEEIDKYDELYNVHLQSIDRQEATNDHNENLKKLQDEQSSLQSQLNIALLNDDTKSKKKREELQKAIADKQKEISELTHGREIELRKQNLQDSLEVLKTEEEAKKTKLEEEKEYLEKYWNETITREKYYDQIREEVKRGHFNKVLADFTVFKNKLALDSGLIGKSITDEIITKMRDMEWQIDRTLKQLEPMVLSIGTTFDSIATRLKAGLGKELDDILDKIQKVNGATIPTAPPPPTTGGNSNNGGISNGNPPGSPFKPKYGPGSDNMGEYNIASPWHAGHEITVEGTSPRLNADGSNILSVVKSGTSGDNKYPKGKFGGGIDPTGNYNIPFNNPPTSGGWLDSGNNSNSANTSTPTPTPPVTTPPPAPTGPMAGTPISDSLTRMLQEAAAKAAADAAAKKAADDAAKKAAADVAAKKAAEDAAKKAAQAKPDKGVGSNQYIYLQNLASTGTADQKTWAKRQLELGNYHVGGEVEPGTNEKSTALHEMFNLNNSEKLAKLLKNEVVINPDNFKLPNLIQSLMSSIKLPSFDMFMPNRSAQFAGMSGDVHVHIENFNGTKADYDSFGKRAVDAINRRGGKV